MAAKNCQVEAVAMLLDRGADLEGRDNVSHSPLGFELAARGPEPSAPRLSYTSISECRAISLDMTVVFASDALRLQRRLWLEHFPCRSAVAAMPCCRMAGLPSIGAGWTLASVRF